MATETRVKDFKNTTATKKKLHAKETNMREIYQQ